MRKTNFPDSELVAFLAGWESTPCRTTWRAAFADWMDTRTGFHKTQLWTGRLPMKLTTLLSQAGSRLPWENSFRKSRTRRAATEWFDGYRINWKTPFKEWGEGRIGGLPVLVGEANRDDFDPESLASHLTTLLPCPVTYDFHAEFAWRFRVAVWFTCPLQPCSTVHDDGHHDTGDVT